MLISEKKKNNKKKLHNRYFTRLQSLLTVCQRINFDLYSDFSFKHYSFL